MPSQHPQAKKSFTPRIFIVEDDQNIRKFIEGLLKDFKYQAASSPSGSEALKRITEMIPDLILMDVLLEDMDGLSVCQKLHSDSRTKKIPIIMISCMTDHSTMKSATAYGAVDFIEKPFKLSVLKDKIQKALAL